MALDAHTVHLICFGAAVAAGCRGCLLHRVRMIPDPQEWMHAAALGAMARERATGRMPTVQAFGALRHYHGIYYREVLDARVVSLIQVAADTTLGMRLGHGPDGAPEEIAEAVALGHRAAARAALDLVAQAVPMFGPQNAHHSAEWTAAGGSPQPFPGWE